MLTLKYTRIHKPIVTFLHSEAMSTFFVDRFKDQFKLILVLDGGCLPAHLLGVSL